MTTLTKPPAGPAVGADAIDYLSSVHVVPRAWPNLMPWSLVVLGGLSEWTDTERNWLGFRAGAVRQTVLAEAVTVGSNLSPRMTTGWSIPSQAPASCVMRIGGEALVFPLSAYAAVSWLSPTLSRVQALVDLDVEDTGRDRPSSPDSIMDALAFFSRALNTNTAPPSLAPLSDGGLQAEWHRGGLDVEVLFSPDPDERGVYIRDKATGDEQDLPLDEAAFRNAVGDRLNLSN